MATKRKAAPLGLRVPFSHEIASPSAR